MKKNLTEIVFILDRSGSMSGLEKDTIGGYNSLLDKQKKEEGEAYISTVLFDDKVEVLHDRVSIDKIRHITEDEYFVRGCTALLDAVGDAIHHIGNVHKYAREEDRPEKTLFVITTDGQENASRRYTYDKVKKMVERQKEKFGWEFLFLGANIDAVKEASRFGIMEDRAVNYECDSRGTEINYRVVSKAISAVRSYDGAVPCEALSEDWKDEIEADYCMRHKKDNGDKRNRGRKFCGRKS
ncbi:MAG: VWA domain-containing protein [Lachnospiraceae bacterium]|nr:VWA domain-containing protein [Lachnospiraceae bacterium]